MLDALAVDRLGGELPPNQMRADRGARVGSRPGFLAGWATDNPREEMQRRGTAMRLAFLFLFHESGARLVWVECAVRAGP